MEEQAEIWQVNERAVGRSRRERRKVVRYVQSNRINTTEEDIIHEYERKRCYVISTVFKVFNVMDCIVPNARHSLYAMAAVAIVAGLH